MSSHRSATASVIVSGALDLVLVVAFVLIGRASHNEGLAGVVTTAWPFLVALTLGWVALRAWRHPRQILGTGIGIWLITVAGGLILRLVAGQGVQLSFAIVTTLVLGVFLLGWRAIWLLIQRRRRA
ncbi:DUF3054 domain-containing protein [Glaciibacter psychrotolerans]|uniref:DUF3054 domain-containing protein n=1 Tax=Glaciibacter psychrotolerans TaxID=670054 RepID=A0A7Z0EI17_9MICO|nr:DUF3054 domain-containing protein [Leifsonia psychrotolerans]NYJ21625.1 hypothetical protein [Leifsonia psychrotolerans]